MKIITKEFFVLNKELNLNGLKNIRSYYNKKIKPRFSNNIPIRFIVAKNTKDGSYCEIDFIEFEKKESVYFDKAKSIFDYNKRVFENTEKFTAAMIIPTGIGAEIGGYCGDGNAAARLVASACDMLITHPNVVNASDINEMPENTLYVEGSILTRLFMGTIGLEKVRSNKLLMIMDKVKDKFFNDEVINAVSSARVTLGVECDVAMIENPIDSCPIYSKSGRAVGNVKKFENLVNLIKSVKNKYDAIGLTTVIKVPQEMHEKYFLGGDDMVNPWGGTEAMITHSVASIFNINCAHSPLSGSMREMHVDLEFGIVDPRKAPETASVTFLHCILKGLHKSPRITEYTKGINLENISCLVIPDGCIGLPVLSCIENNIPVIAVKNKNNMKNNLESLPFKEGKLFFADNYLEAAGILSALKAGVSVGSVLRPIGKTKVIKTKI